MSGIARLLMVFGLIVIPVLGRAQTSADTVAITEAATRWYASQTPTSSRVVAFLLPGRHPTGPALTPTQIEAAQQGARILGATLIPYDGYWKKICDRKKPEDCGPGKFDLIVDVRVNRITGNTSEVFVNQHSAAGPGPRLSDSMVGWILLFVHSDHGWAFSRIIGMDAT